MCYWYFFFFINIWAFNVWLLSSTIILYSLSIMLILINKDDLSQNDILWLYVLCTFMVIYFILVLVNIWKHNVLCGLMKACTFFLCFATLLSNIHHFFSFYNWADFLYKSLMPSLLLIGVWFHRFVHLTLIVKMKKNRCGINYVYVLR